MLRRIILFTGGLALAAAGGMAMAPAGGAAGGGGCQVNGTANFTPNGPGTTSTFSYSVNGQLSSCQSNVAGAPASGAIAVGQQLVETVTINGLPAQATYAEPLATGSGTVPVNSCPGGATAGTAVVTWPDSTTTIVNYTTSSAGPAVKLQGTVVPSVTLTLVSGPAGSPATYTLNTTNPTFPVNNGAQGAVAFTTNDPTPCNTAAGLPNVALQGFVGLGSTS